MQSNTNREISAHADDGHICTEVPDVHLHVYARNAHILYAHHIYNICQGVNRFNECVSCIYI